MRALIARLVTATIIGTSAPASAAVVNVTYTGIINTSADSTGIFGQAGLNTYVGTSFVAHYVFDTSLGRTNAGPNYSITYGGDTSSSTSPAIGASVIINGVTQIVPVNYYSQIYHYQNGSYGQTAHYAGDSYDNPYQYFSQYVEGNVYGPDKTLPPTSTSYSYTPGTSHLDNQYLTYQSIFTDYITGASAYTFIHADITSIEASIAGAVPEPATWAMMFLGFAGIAGMAYRSRGRARAGAAI